MRRAVLQAAKGALCRTTTNRCTSACVTACTHKNRNELAANGPVAMAGAIRLEGSYFLLPSAVSSNFPIQVSYSASAGRHAPPAACTARSQALQRRPRIIRRALRRPQLLDSGARCCTACQRGFAEPSVPSTWRQPSWSWLGSGHGRSQHRLTWRGCVSQRCSGSCAGTGWRCWWPRALPRSSATHCRSARPARWGQRLSRYMSSELHVCARYRAAPG